MAKKTQAAETPWQSKIVGYETVTTDSILANPRNWRIHPSPQQNALLGAIHGVGIIQNIVINKRTSELWPPGDRYVETLCDGHLRVTLALREGQPTLPVTFVDLTPDEENLLLATFDPIAALAGVDTGQLGSLLHETTTGDAMLMEFLSNLAEEHGIIPPDEQKPVVEVEAEVDRAEELRKHYGVQVGQCWQLGEHRVICGDCTDKAVAERLMQGETPDIMINDPPYGMRLNADFSSMTSKLRFARDKADFGGHAYATVQGDHEDFDADTIFRLMNTVEEQFWFGADYYAASLGDTQHTGSWLVWDKSLDETMDRVYGSCFELIWSRQKHKRFILRHKWAGIFGMEKETQHSRIHPTQKPVVLLEDLLTRYSPEGSLVVDLFLGSGTTLIAAQQLGRTCYGCEIDPGYTAVCLERFYKLTGVQPVLLDTGT